MAKVTSEKETEIGGESEKEKEKETEQMTFQSFVNCKCFAWANVNGLFRCAMQHIREKCVSVFWIVAQHIVRIFVFVFMQICWKCWNNDANDDGGDDDHHHC